jgi:hypothetical protein
LTMAKDDKGAAARVIELLQAFELMKVPYENIVRLSQLPEKTWSSFWKTMPIRDGFIIDLVAFQTGRQIDPSTHPQPANDETFINHDGFTLKDFVRYLKPEDRHKLVIAPEILELPTFREGPLKGKYMIRLPMWPEQREPGDQLPLARLYIALPALFHEFLERKTDPLGGKTVLCMESPYLKRMAIRVSGEQMHVFLTDRFEDCSLIYEYDV